MTQLHVQAHNALNDYLTKELGQTLFLHDIEELTRQRNAFLEQFGPDVIRAMSDEELLRQLPLNASNPQPMDYWLDHKSDDAFDNQLFGSIAGGIPAKFGCWQKKQTGQWMGLGGPSSKIGEISKEAALEIVRNRRSEILSSIAALRAIEPVPVEQIDPESFQRTIEDAAPKNHSYAWLHKYLHMAFPNHVTWSSTQSYSKSELYRVGVRPIAKGLYGQDIQTIRFWNSLPALQPYPIEIRYRVLSGMVVPRNYWRVGLQDDTASLEEMLANDHLMFGPNSVGSLGEASSFSKKKDVQQVVRTAFEEADVDPSGSAASSLTALTYNLTEGSVVAIFADDMTVVAVGEVSGPYRFVQNAEYPHQLSVRWRHTHAFQLTRPVPAVRAIERLHVEHVAVADIDASLLCYSDELRPDTSQPIEPHPVAKGTTVTNTVTELHPAPEPPAPLDGLAKDIVTMLDRKRQVILYGPPGTGKTYHAESIALEMVARENFGRTAAQLKSGQRDIIFGRTSAPPYIETCTFHPMYSYEDFIEGYRPDGNGFVLESGIFKRMATAAAAEPDKRFVLVIDEINRGNIPKIFGELITLIEASKRGTTSATLPLSKTRFTVPDNLYVIGTMNTADRSILLLDTALRRRFAFKELLPDAELLKSSYIGDVRLSTWLRALNRRIVEQLGRDGRNLQVGHAYLMQGGKPAATLQRIGQIVRDEIWPLLQEYCYDDPNKLANILIGGRHSLYDREKADLRYELFEPGRGDALTQALIAIITPDDKAGDEAILEEAHEDDENSEEDRFDDELIDETP